MKKNLWAKLIAAALIVASIFTFASCDMITNVLGGGDESGNESDLGGAGAIIDDGLRAENMTPSENLTFTLTSDKKAMKMILL